MVNLPQYRLSWYQFQGWKKINFWGVENMKICLGDITVTVMIYSSGPMEHHSYCTL